MNCTDYDSKRLHQYQLFLLEVAIDKIEVYETIPQCLNLVAEINFECFPKICVRPNEFEEEHESKSGMGKGGESIESESTDGQSEESLADSGPKKESLKAAPAPPPLPSPKGNDSLASVSAHASTVGEGVGVGTDLSPAESCFKLEQFKELPLRQGYCFNSCRSILFPRSPLEMIHIVQRKPVIISFHQKTSKNCLVELGKASIPLQPGFYVAISQAIRSDIRPISATMFNTYNLINDDKETIGRANIMVRLTCLGCEHITKLKSPQGDLMDRLLSPLVEFKTKYARRAVPKKEVPVCEWEAGQFGSEIGQDVLTCPPFITGEEYLGFKVDEGRTPLQRFMEQIENETRLAEAQRQVKRYKEHEAERSSPDFFEVCDNSLATKYHTMYKMSKVCKKPPC